MSRSFGSGTGRKFLFAVVVVAIVAAVFLLPRTPVKAGKSLVNKTESHQPGLENYDIRTDKHAIETIASFRTLAGRNAPEIADARDEMVRGEEKLKRKVPTLKVEYNIDLKIPEVIAPDVKQGKAFLSRPTSGSRADALKNFLSGNTELIGARPEQVDQLKVFSDYTNPDGQLSFVELNQEVDGIPVFRGEVKAGFTKSGEIIRVINNFAPGLDESLSTDFGDPSNAVRAAAAHINNTKFAQFDLTPNTKLSSDQKVILGEGDLAPIAEKMYFPTEPGVAVPAWRVLIWQPVNAFYVIVDAKTGTMLWRKNITEDQTQPATYNVYANPNAMVNIAHSPFPMSPAPASPNGIQGNPISRTMVTRIGNEPPFAFNNLGWITDGDNILDGNNVEAGLDREAPNDGSLDPEAIDPGSVPSGSLNRIFDFPINPSIPTNPAANTGDSPLPVGQNSQICLEEGTAGVPTDFQKAAITQLFYISNIFHDETYRLGFTESARNFQNDNFGRGGFGGDRVSAQAQDCSGINNANFSTPADGVRPQMQMFLWQGPDPDIDGSLDADVIIHELAHGLSSRLHGNGSGLALDIARGMGEGWSDFYAHCLLSQPSDPIDGLYTIGAYDTYLFQNVGFNNYYYGIRRFPKAIKSALGGPDNRPHNPLTFSDIDSETSDASDGAFSPRYTPSSDQVHNIGEVWSSALWEIRARMIQRLGWEVGNRRVLQFVTDGMKLAPLGPTPISERDAMLAAIFASGTADDLADAWAGFAVRGFGTEARVRALGGVSTGGTNTVRVTESFALPNIAQSPIITISDSTGDNDGFPEAGETLTLSIPLTNSTGSTATNVTVQVVGGNSVSFGTMTGISTATRQTTFIVPPAAVCGSVINLTLDLTSSLGPVTFTTSFVIGQPVVTFTENFDTISPPAIPSGWSVTSSYQPMTFVSTASGSDSSPNSMFAADLPNCSSSCPLTNGGSTELTSPVLTPGVDASLVSFRHRYNSEAGWDGGVLEISIADGPFQDIVTAGGAFVQNGYNAVIGVSTPNPLGGRSGWTGNSNGYITTIARLPVAANGQGTRLRWRFGTDSNGAPAGGGWNVDTIQFSGSYSCSFPIPMASISGRVVTPSGIALRNAVVTLTDAVSVQRRVTTSSFGLFSFSDVPVGQSVTVNVGSKRYRFAPRTLHVAGSVANLEMIGLE